MGSARVSSNLTGVVLRIVRKYIESRRRGGLAQSEERNVSNVEAPGSKPGISIVVRMYIFYARNSSSYRIVYKKFKKWKKNINNMHPVGFEPTHPKITELESIALDHSATDASYSNDYCSHNATRTGGSDLAQR